MALRTAMAVAMGLGALVLATGTGCSAEVPGEQSDDVAVSPALGGMEEKAAALFGVCTAAQVQSHVQATKLLQYVFGDDSKAPPSTAGACSNLKTALQQLRTIVASPTTQISTAQMGDAACGSGSRPMYVLNDANPTLPIFGTIPDAIRSNVDVCYPGLTVGAYLLPLGFSTQIWLDPEPATLTANLSSTSGATAAAYFETSTNTTTVSYRSGAAAACGKLVGGEPCSTTALATGSKTAQMIMKTSTICTCR